MPIIIPSSLQLSCLGGFRLSILLCTCSTRGATDPGCFQWLQKQPLKERESTATFCKRNWWFRSEKALCSLPFQWKLGHSAKSLWRYHCSFHSILVLRQSMVSPAAPQCRGWARSPPLCHGTTQGWAWPWPNKSCSHWCSATLPSCWKRVVSYRIYHYSCLQRKTNSLNQRPAICFTLHLIADFDFSCMNSEFHGQVLVSWGLWWSYWYAWTLRILRPQLKISSVQFVRSRHENTEIEKC